MPIFRLSRQLLFPDPQLAEEDGLLAVGGDLRRERLLLAYRHGIFPWYAEGDPILWWSPDPRFVLFPEGLHVSDSLRRVIKSGRFEVTRNRDFRAVIEACRDVPRPGQPGTWITDAMVRAYCDLHAAGHALSVEVWREGVLTGGLYGVIVGRCFSGESMFCRQSNASKVGFAHLVGQLRAEGFTLIDCQLYTAYLESFGAVEIPRERYLELLEAAQERVQGVRVHEERVNLNPEP